MSRTRSAGRAAWVVLLVGVACCTTHVIGGRVVDAGSGDPVAGAYVVAAQSGWGLSHGLVWDKDLSDTTRTDPDGRFLLRYRAGPVARLHVLKAGYNAWSRGFAPRRDVRIALKRLVAGAPLLPNGYLRIGLHTSGRTYGWDFAAGRLTEERDAADLFPDRMGPALRDNVVLSAPGGIQCGSAEALGAGDELLVYGDSAPAAGYGPGVLLDFRGPALLCFVRTRDGARYLKFAFTPGGFASDASADVTRDLSLRYVVNPWGDRALVLNAPPVPPAPPAESRAGGGG